MHSATHESDIVTRTGRLQLVPLRPIHAPELHRLQNDWEVVRMLANIPWPLTLAGSEAAARKQLSAHRESDDFVVLLGSNAIGVCAVKRPGRGDPRAMPRLGFWLGRAYWGRGYATEAVGAIVGWAFDATGAERVGAGVFDDNPASRRLLENLGFSEAGRYLTACLSRREAVPTTDMRLERGSWRGS